MLDYNRLPQIFKTLQNKGLYYNLQLGTFNWEFNGCTVLNMKCYGTTLFACYREWDIGPDEKYPVVEVGYFNDIKTEDALYKIVDEKINYYSDCLKEFKKRKVEVKKKELSKDFEAT